MELGWIRVTKSRNGHSSRKAPSWGLELTFSEGRYHVNDEEVLPENVRTTIGEELDRGAFKGEILCGGFMFTWNRKAALVRPSYFA